MTLDNDDLDLDDLIDEYFDDDDRLCCAECDAVIGEGESHDPECTWA